MIHALASDRGTAVVTEAQPEEELGDRAVAVVAALMVIAMRERQVADGLELEGGDRVAAHVGGHVADVAADIGMRRAEARDVAVAERVPDRRVGMARPERRVVRVVDPDPHGQAPSVRLANEPVERVLVLDEATRERPDGAAVGASARTEEGVAALVEDDLAHGVVGQDVARMVIDARVRHGVDLAEVLDAAERDVVALVNEVGGEDVRRRFHAAAFAIDQAESRVALRASARVP